MKKWQELIFSTLYNIVAALIVAGILTIFIEEKKQLESMSMIVSGILTFIALSWITKKMEA
jgi:hypothetical protein